MPQLNPQELSAAISERLQKYFNGTYLPGEMLEFDLVGFRRDIDRLAKVDRVLADRAEVDLETLSYNYDRCRSLLENVRLLGAVDIARHGYFQLNSNFLYATEALGVLRDVFDNPADQAYHDIMTSASAIGAFGEIVAAIERSALANRVIQPSKFIDLARQAKTVLDSFGITDQHVAQVADLAGAIMRERKVLWTGSGPSIYVLPIESGNPVVSMEYQVAVSADEAAKMTWLLYERIVAADLDAPGLSMGFLGVREAGEEPRGH